MKTEGPSEILHSVATLAAMVSHEINNPLMIIVANLELLERTHTLDAHGRARLEAAVAAVHQIKETVRRLGRIRRLELADGGPNVPPMLDLEKSSRGAHGEHEGRRLRATHPATSERIEARQDAR